jgi:hypothetical protein
LSPKITNVNPATEINHELTKKGVATHDGLGGIPRLPNKDADQNIATTKMNIPINMYVAQKIK